MQKYLNLALGVAILVVALTIIIKPRPAPVNQAQPLLADNEPPPVKQSTNQPEETTMPTPTKQYSQAAQVTEVGKSYQATLHTSAGDITIALDNNTPATINNFVFLAQEGYYDNTIFHRVINGFMIQGGDPTGTGAGSPGYQFADEPFEGEYTRGTVAMANAGPNTNGGQFFIMHQDYNLPPNYVIFGHVIKGLETVDQIATAPVKASQTGELSTPVSPVTLKSVTITTSD